MHLPTGLLAGLRQRLDEIVPVHVVQKDALATVPSSHDRLHRARILDAELARHFIIRVLSRAHVNANNNPRYGLTAADSSGFGEGEA